MALSIPQLQNRMIYNFSPTLQLQTLLAQPKLRINHALYDSYVSQTINNIRLFMQTINIDDSILQYQKYFNRTIFKQAQKLIPQRCIFNAGIVHGNNDIVIPTIVSNDTILSIDKNDLADNIDDQIVQIMTINNTLRSNIDNIQPIAQATFNNLQNENYRYIYNICSINYTTKDTLLNNQSIAVGLQITYTYNNSDVDAIEKFNINPNKLVTKNINDNTKVKIDLI